MTRGNPLLAANEEGFPSAAYQCFSGFFSTPWTHCFQHYRNFSWHVQL